MKTTLLTILFFLTVSTILVAQVCPNTPITYPKTCISGGCLYPVDAMYSDFTHPTQYMNGDDLIVIWSHTGTGMVGYSTFTTPEDEVEEWSNEIIVTTLAFTSAPSVICNGQTLTYSISDNCGTSFNWLAPSGWSINGGGNTLTTSLTNVSISAPSFGKDIASITVTSNTSGTISQSVMLGAPTPVLTSSVDNDIPGHTVLDVSTILLSGSYNWYVNNVFSRTNATGTFAVIVPCNTQDGVKCTLSNSCGTSAFSNSVSALGTCPNGHKGSVVASPNPASTQLSISVEEPFPKSTSLLSDASTENNVSSEMSSVTGAKDFQAFLYNTSEKLVKTGISKNGKLIFDLTDIPSGEYILHVNNQGEISKNRIQISK